MATGQRLKRWLRGIGSRSPSPSIATTAINSKSTITSSKALKVAEAQVTVVQSESLARSSLSSSTPVSPTAENTTTIDRGPGRVSIILWKEARTLLSEGNRIFFDSPGQPVHGQDILSQLQLYATEKHRLVAENAWKIDFGGRRIVLRDVASKIVVWINAFKQVGDVVAGFDPAHTALPWAAIKILLQVVIADQEQAGQILIAVEQLTCLMARCNTYERLYLDSDDAAQVLSELRSNIVQLYAKVLSFLAFYLRSLDEQGPMKAIKLLVKTEDLSDLLTDLGRWESRVEMAAAVCEKYLQHVARHANDANSRTLHQLLNQLDNDMVRLWKKLDDDDRCSIFRWISDIPYETDHYNARKGRVEGTGEWLFANSTYSAWRNGSSSMLLWLNGIPGAGKTKLSSKVVDSLLAQLGSEDGNMALAYFYCDRNRADHRDPVAVLRSLVRQISAPRDESAIISSVERAYRERKRFGFAKDQLTIEECQSLLHGLVESYSQSIFVIDGLDECERQMRQLLMDVLDAILAKSSHSVKIFIASRKDQDIKDHYRTGLEVTADDNQADIEKFVIDKMEQSDFCRKKMSAHVRQEVLRTFHDKSQGMFQWAALQIGELLELKRNKDILQYLDRLPRGLEAAYDKIYRNISAQPGSKRDVAFATFKLLMCSWRPLSPSELVIAATQDPESDLYIDDDVDIDYVISACQNLVIVSDGQPGPDEFSSRNSPKPEPEEAVSNGGYVAVYVSDAKEAEVSSRLKSTLKESVCRFSHLSVREYLEAHHWTAAEANAFTASICLRTLLRLRVGESATGSVKLQGDDEPDDDVSLTLSVLRTERSYRRQLIWPEDDDPVGLHTTSNYVDEDEVQRQASNLRPPPFLCFIDLAPDQNLDENSSCVSGEFDTYIEDHRGTGLELWTEYAASTWFLHTRRATSGDRISPSVETLLSQFLGNSSKASPQYQAWSILNQGNIDLSMDQPELLGHDFNKRQFRRSSITPTTNPAFGCAYLGLHNVLCAYIENGLLGVDQTNKQGDTLLLLAVQGSHFDACAVLLTHGANPNCHDHNGVTPLQFATENKRHDIVSILLDHDADPNFLPKESTKHPPVIIAVEEAQTHTVRLLLERGADAIFGKVNSQHKALSIAASAGDRDLVRLLLERYAKVDGWIKNLHLWEALDAACSSESVSSEAVVGLLIDNGADFTDSAAMHTAVFNGNLGAAKALLDHKADVNARAPTWFGNGYETMMERQAAITRVIAGERYAPPLFGISYWEQGDTPLMAALRSSEKVDRLALARQLIDWGADVNAKDFWGRTSLRLAVEVRDEKMEEIVELLVSKGADANIKDRAGVSALDAARSGQKASKTVIQIMGGRVEADGGNDLAPASEGETRVS